MRAVFSSLWLVAAAADACCCGATAAGVSGPAGATRWPLVISPGWCCDFSFEGLIACGPVDLLRLVESRVVADGCFRSSDHDFVVVAMDIARMEGHVARGEVQPNPKDEVQRG